MCRDVRIYMTLKRGEGTNKSQKGHKHLLNLERYSVFIPHIFILQQASFSCPQPSQCTVMCCVISDRPAVSCLAEAFHAGAKDGFSFSARCAETHGHDI